MNQRTIVQKYGGTSVADIGCIKNVAARVAEAARDGNRVVAVVSAMAGQTDRLIGLAREMSKEPGDRELDLLMATGEQASVALLSLALRQEGVETETFLGHQAIIRTDANHGRARIEGIDPTNVRNALDGGKVAVEQDSDARRHQLMLSGPGSGLACRTESRVTARVSTT